MKKLIVSIFATLIFTQSAQASLIGIFGDRGEKNTLASNLTAFGHSVTVFGDDISGNLSAYDSIWGVSAFDAISSTEQSALSDYLASGGGLYLTGERPCCEVLNQSLTTFVNGVVDGPTVQIGGLGDAGSSSSINQTVVGNLASAPNSVSSWTPNASGAISGVVDDNIFAYTSSNQVIAAAWDMDDLVDDAGRLVVMMDVNWLSNSGQLDLLENIEVFLNNATVLQAPPQQPQVAASAPASLLIMILGVFGVSAARRKMRVKA